MREYFNFTLTAKKFLPIWLILYFIVILPYLICFKTLRTNTQVESLPPVIGFLYIIMMLGALIIPFFIMKISIESIKYSESQIHFEGKLGKYIGKILLGSIFTIITIGIYMAWFIKDLTRFMVNNSILNDTNFEFKGKGVKLLIIILLSMFLPFILLTLIMSKHISIINQNFFYFVIYQSVFTIILIPYMYLIYNWMVNVKFKDYQIKWQTDFFASCLKILQEVIFSIITCGIYMPLAYVKLYKYFTERTIAETNDKTLQFGYELEAKDDFLFIWGQLLLTLVTVGIYYPWAYSKIGKRILSKTYLENKNA